jgi:CBS domain-containing protein
VRQTQVRDLMTADVRTVGPDDSFQTIVRALLEKNIDAAPVVDANGRLLGVVSQSDLTCHDEEQGGWTELLRGGREARAHRRKARARTAAELMTSPAVCVPPKTPVCEALHVMAQRGVGRVLITEGDRMVGILARSDVLRSYVRDDGEIRDDVRGAIDRTLGELAGGLHVEVREGVVLLTGRTQRVSSAWEAVALAYDVSGVVAVEDDVRSEVDDTEVHAMSVSGPFA